MSAIRLDQPYYEQRDHREVQADQLLARGLASLSCLMSPLRRKRLANFAEDVERHGSMILPGSESALLDAAFTLRARLVRQGLTRENAIQAFALTREACARQTGLRHYRVQIMGGAAMLGRCIAEMETGEGKTITAVLPAAAFAMSGLPVHIVTVNDYLAERDSSQLRPVYEALGLTVGLVTAGQRPDERRDAYAADITYCTNKHLVFDYLRDRLVLGRSRGRPRQLIDALTQSRPPASAHGLLLRGLHVAIVDEADSVLIDEARTPLILAGAAGNDTTSSCALYSDALALARSLKPDTHWYLDRKERGVALTQDGRETLARLANGYKGLWQTRRAREELAERALAALHLYHRDTQYVVSDDKIQIVDEFTGRTMPERSWEFGLHQMIEAKEGLETSSQKTTLARITFQRFFRRYGHLTGMTGTVMEVAGEIACTYGLSAIRIPTNRPSRRQETGRTLFLSSEKKWAAVLHGASRCTADGRSLLIGTRSVEISERLSALLTAAGLKHAVLNARQDREEAEIIAAAGQRGRITIATNMAGRGTDIRLSREVREAGGLQVFLTEFHESERIDRQLFGRGGRQGDPGGYECFATLDDEVLARFGAPYLRRLCRFVVDRHTGTVPCWLAWLLVRSAQSAAGRLNTQTRRQTLLNDRSWQDMLAFTGEGE